MSEGFYQLDNKVLKFKIPKDSDKILFNHYLMQKENIERTKGTLPRGWFYITINAVSNDLNISFAKAQRLIKEFIELGIITNIYKSPKGQNKPSIYQYNVSAIEYKHSNTNGFDSVDYNCNKSDNEDDNGFDNQKPSDTNELNDDSDNGFDNESDNSKKKNLNTIFKNTSSTILEEQIDKLWKLYPNKKGKATALKLMPKLIGQYGYGQIERAVKRYKSECRDKNINYIKQGDTFFKGGYQDYLDESYESIQQSSRNSHMYKEL